MSETSSPNPAKQIVSRAFRGLARAYVNLHKPVVIAVGGSIGKTSTKLMLARILETQKKVSYMDDSYNTGLGLYLSVFELKVPVHSNVISWLGKLLHAAVRLLTKPTDILIVEYGIDGVGDMDEMVEFIRPDVSVLTAVAPEHMEFLKDMDTVGAEETKLLRAAKRFAVVNAADVDEKYLTDISAELLRYGRSDDASSYNIHSWTEDGPRVHFEVEGKTIDVASMHIISDALIRQLSGALLVASHLGVDVTSLGDTLASLRPAAGRMDLLEAVNGARVIDDTANFSPVAGVAALRTLKHMPAARHIAVLGNMHELGEFADEGYRQVAAEFDGIDALVLVGDLSEKWFQPFAEKQGFVEGDNLFIYPDALTAGTWLKGYLTDRDILLVKGPFGGWYLEEVVRLVLRNSQDVQYLTRQSDFWHTKKTAHFGAAYTESFS